MSERLRLCFSPLALFALLARVLDAQQALEEVVAVLQLRFLARFAQEDHGAGGEELLAPAPVDC